MEIQKNLNIKWQNVLITWNRSYKNLGDELILVGTIKLLQQQGKNIFVQAYDPKWLKGFLKQFVDVSDITFFREIPKWPRSILKYIWKKWWTELWDYRKIDSVIVGGWEILTEENPNSYRYRLVSILPILTRKLIVKTDIYLMWWIQIPKKSLNLKLFKELLKHTTHIYARDFETVDELQKFWYKNVEFFMDTAYFAWNWKDNQSRLSSPHSGSSQWNARYIVININKNGEKFLDEIIEDVKWYAEKWFHIYYVPVSKGRNPEYNDGKYLDVLKKYSKIEVLDWENNITEFFKVIKWAEIVISTRLHLFLVASFLGVKSKVYPYQKKILKMQKVLEKFS